MLPSPPAAPHIALQTHPHFSAILFTPDKPFPLSSPHLLVIPLMANPWPTPHQRNYVCYIMHYRQGVRVTLAHCWALFPSSRPRQMIPFQLISGKMQLSQMRMTRMLLSRIAPAQSAQGPETRAIKQPPVP